MKNRFLNKITILHFILVLIIILVGTRFFEIYISFKLMVNYVILNLNRYKNISSLLDLETADQFLAMIFLLGLLAILLIKAKFTFLQRKISLPNSFIMISLFIFFLCPLIAPFHPGLQFNLPMAKNLPPLTSRYLVERFKEKSGEQDYFREYITLKNKINRQFVYEDFFLSEEDISKYKKQNVFSEKIIFLFGTDEYGRDVFSRIVFATRLSLFIGISAVLITLVIGLVLGFISGFFGSTIDISLNRITETFLAFPTIFLIILFLAFFGNSLWNLVLVLGFAGWMSMFKVVRGEVISLKNKNHIITSRKIGMSLPQILTKEFLPLLLPVIITNLTFQFSNVVIAESSLSFLGLSGNTSHPTWGAMIQEGQYYLVQAWWISFFPSAFLIITLLTFNNYGKRIKGRQF